MRTVRNPHIQLQPAVDQLRGRSLPQMIRRPLPVAPLTVRPPLPVRYPEMSVTEMRIYQMLSLLFVLIPLVAGVDKFFYSITDWDRYVPTLLTSIHIAPHPVMMAVGVLEIAIACLVAINPRIGSLAMLLMLGGIILDLLALPRQLHVVLLDCCLCVSALCLFLLASKQQMLRRSSL